MFILVLTNLNKNDCFPQLLIELYSKSYKFRGINKEL